MQDRCCSLAHRPIVLSPKKCLNDLRLHFPHEPGMYYKPKSGDGIIFPGWLSHQVQQHQSDNERIIVVGNVEGTGAVNYPQRSFTDVNL